MNDEARVEPVEGSLSAPPRSDKAILPAASAAPVEAVEVLRELVNAHNEYAGYRYTGGRDAYYTIKDRYLAAWDRARTLVAQPPQAVQEDERKYDELLYAVARKFPGESRHETALRYIREAEARACDSGPAKSATTEPKQ